ncbi:MAG: hypothetical protein IT428_24420 [Planctomycetaceae bacterium]|nr:hypothetical protein [Planctomycetaceae bacterium]
MRRTVFLLAVLSVAATCLAGDLLHRRTKTIRVCTIPPYGYDYRPASLPVYEISETAVFLTAEIGPIRVPPDPTAPSVPPAPPVPPGAKVVVVAPTPAVPLPGLPRPLPLRAKSFQFETRALQIDHCLVSNIVLTLREDGVWFASFRAEQNPALVPVEVRPQAERFVRNRFRLRFHPVALSPLPADPNLRGLAPPQPVDIEVPPVWVEKGDVQTLQLTHQLPAVREYFDSIERVQVEFRYE